LARWPRQSTCRRYSFGRCGGDPGERQLRFPLEGPIAERQDPGRTPVLDYRQPPDAPGKRQPGPPAAPAATGLSGGTGIDNATDPNEAEDDRQDGSIP